MLIWFDSADSGLLGAGLMVVQVIVLGAALWRSNTALAVGWLSGAILGFFVLMVWLVGYALSMGT